MMYTKDNPRQALFIMGVSGSGKSAVGRKLSERTGIPFFDGDDFHPKANLEKMQSGQPLDDADRYGWLEAIHHFVVSRSDDVIIACSALKECYRKQLMRDVTGPCEWVVLRGAYDLLYERLSKRKGHFMPPALLQSQFDTLELPRYGLHVEVTLSVEEIVDRIINHFCL